MTNLIAAAPSSERAVGVTATATSTTAVLSCSACCVLPLALPATALAGAGATLSLLETASPWLTLFSVGVVLAAWIIVWRQSAATGKRAARSTIIMLSISTGLTVIALVWPLIEGDLVTLLK